MCSAIGAIGAIGEGVLTNRIRLCILDMSGETGCNCLPRRVTWKSSGTLRSI